MAYDGYVSDCTVVVGGLPRADGTFDKVDGFATAVKGGRFGVPSRLLGDAPGERAAYVVPAARDGAYEPISSPDAAPGHCFDRGTLLPVYNPLAVRLPATPEAVAAGAAASPLSTLLVFGAAAGLTPDRLNAALGLSPGLDVSSFDALAAAKA